MSFKLFVKKSLIIFLVVLLGCASENEKPSDVVVLNFSTPKTKSFESEMQKGNLFCLSGFAEHLEAFLTGRISEQELSNFWSCTAYAVNIYQTFVEPDTDGKYSASGLQRFVESKITRSSLNPDLMKEIMSLKSVILGGSKKYFTNQELNDFKKLLTKDLKDITIKLRPEMPVIVSGILIPKKPGLTETELNRGISALREAMYDFGRVFARKNRSYPINRIKGLFNTVQPMFTGGNPESIFSNVDKLIPVIIETKVLLVGPGRNEIKSQEWSQFFVLIANAYTIWLRYNNFIKGESITQGTALNQVYRLVDDVLAHVKIGIAKRIDPIYENSEAKKLIKSLHDFVGLPLGLTVDAALKAWTWFSDRLLQEKDNAKLVRGLTPMKLSKLQTQLSDWYLKQVHINENNGEDFDPTNPMLGQIKELVAGLKFPLNMDDKGRIELPAVKKGMDFKTLTLINIERIISNLIIESYSGLMRFKNPQAFMAGMKLIQENLEKYQKGELSLEPYRTDSLVDGVSLYVPHVRRAYITRDELELLIGEIAPIAEPLGLGSLDVKSFARSVYRDTNLFLPHSNGNELIEFEEMTEYFHYLISGWNQNKIWDHLVVSTCQQNFEDGTLDRKCFEKIVLQNREDLFGHLPKLNNYLKKLSEKDLERYPLFFKRVEQTVGMEDSLLPRVNKFSIFEMSVLYQYLETMFAHFDKDNNSMVEPAEAMEFLDQNISVVGSMMGINTEYLETRQLISAIFTYMLKYEARHDDPTDKVAELRFDFWLHSRDQWEFQSDRAAVAFILSILGSK